MSTGTPTRLQARTSVRKRNTMMSTLTKITKEWDAATIILQRLERDAVQNPPGLQIILPGNPTIRPKHGKCYLLRIPVELRYMIYHYALSYEEGLNYRYEEDNTTFKLYPVIEAKHEINRFKYVNHQLCAETPGLAIKVNDLEFLQISLSHLEPGKQFLSFMKNCTEKMKKSLRKISVNMSYPTSKDCAVSKLLPEGADSIYAIARFCTTHPKSYVHFTHSVKC